MATCKRCEHEFDEDDLGETGMCVPCEEDTHEERAESISRNIEAIKDTQGTVTYGEWEVDDTVNKHTGVVVKILDLAGPEGNAFAIIGKVRTAMKRAGISDAIIEAYTKEATSGDYENLLKVTKEYVHVESI